MAIAHFTFKAFSRYIGDTTEMFPEIVNIKVYPDEFIGIKTRKDQNYHCFGANSFENYFYGALGENDNYKDNPGWYGVGYTQAFYPFATVVIGFDVAKDNTATFLEMITTLKEHCGGLGYKQEVNVVL